MRKISLTFISCLLALSMLLASCGVAGKSGKDDDKDTSSATEFSSLTEDGSDVSEPETSVSDTSVTDTTAVTTTETTSETTTEATTTETTANPLEPYVGEYKLVAAKFSEKFLGKENAWRSKYTFNTSEYKGSPVSKMSLLADGTGKIFIKKGDKSSDTDVAWGVSGESFTASSSKGDVKGTLKDGVWTVELADGVFYYVANGTELKGVKTTTLNKALISEGNSYYYGTAEKGCDLKNAESLYKLLEKENDIYGSYALGRLWAENRFTDTEHYKKAIEYYNKCIKADYPLGYYGMGRLYMTGSLYASGVKQDLVKAKEYLEKAYKKGRLEAAVFLGYMYKEGLIDGADGADGKTALKYFNEAVKSDSAYIRGMANMYLGALYYNGAKGVEKDFEKALTYLEQADKDGNKEAPASLGYLYLYGYGVDKNEKKAAEYIKRAAKRGSGYGYVYLYDCYYNGIGGVDKDESKLDGLAKKAAEFGAVRGLELLGNDRFFVTGAKEDFKEAAKYYRMAYKENSAYACGKLAYMAYYGKGLKKDRKEFFNYAKRGEDLGDMYSVYLVGYGYCYGVGTKKSPKKALEKLSYYIKYGSAESTIKDSKDLLKKLVKSGQLKQKDVDKALK